MTDWEYFKKYGKESGAWTAGCAGLIAGLVIIALVIFIEPLIICKAWSMFAVAMDVCSVEHILLVEAEKNDL